MVNVEVNALLITSPYLQGHHRIRTSGMFLPGDATHKTTCIYKF